MKDRPRHRLFVEADLGSQAAVPVSEGQAHYLTHVLRMAEGDGIVLFNGRDGEWRGELERVGKKAVTVRCADLLASQPVEAETTLVFAPIRGAKVELIAEKATELGASRLIPALTRRSVVDRVNISRMRANSIEAAEQCGRLAVPHFVELRRLDQILGDWDRGTPLFFCDEAGDAAHLLAAAQGIGDRPAAILIGPEGGFDPSERDLLRRLPFVTPVALGHRILRAETAAIAALTLMDAARNAPSRSVGA